jgi:hypothetical protein
MLSLRCKSTLPLVKILFIVHGRDFILSFVYESTIQNSHGWISLQLPNLIVRLFNSYLHIYQLLHFHLCRRYHRRLVRVPFKLLRILGLVVIHYFRLQERHRRYRHFHCPVPYYLGLSGTSGLSVLLRKTAFKLIFIGDSYSDTSVCPPRGDYRSCHG